MTMSFSENVMEETNNSPSTHLAFRIPDSEETRRDGATSGKTPLGTHFKKGEMLFLSREEA
jgi:hypothetical protein